MLLEYPMKDVYDKKLVKIHVRGSSRKDKIDTNNKLMLFILHENELYRWIMMDEHSVSEQKLQKVCDVKSNRFNSVNDGRFYMLQETIGDDFKKMNRVIMIKLYFTEFHHECVYQEKESQELIEFGLDDFQNKLLLLSKPIRKKTN